MENIRKLPFKSNGKTRYTVYDGLVLKGELLSETDADALIARIRAEYERQNLESSRTENTE